MIGDAAAVAIGIEPTITTPCGRLQLYLGDNLEILPQLAAGSVDAVITDPPYGFGRPGSEGFQTHVSRHGTLMGIGDHAWNRTLPLDWITLAARLLRPGGAMIAWTDAARTETMWEAFRSAGVHPLRKLYWWKYSAPPNFRKNWPSHVEEAVFGRVAGKVLAWDYREAESPVIRHPAQPDSDRIHPTQKPLEVFRRCVAPVTAPGHVVLDPFMGSGSSGVCAIRMGRRFVGIERDEPYFRAAADRLLAEVSQGKLWA